MDELKDEKTLRRTYWSLAEFASEADKSADPYTRQRYDGNTRFSGGLTFSEAVEMARDGWAEELPEALALAESAVEMATREHMMDTFQPVWDVTGAEVDVATFLAGTPECMIDYPLSKTSHVGRVITLVSSMAASSAVSADSIKRYGRVICALAFALTRLGHSVEIWRDHVAHSTGSYLRAESRVLIKGTADELDPGVIMFALGHSAMLRCLNFGTEDGMPAPWRASFGNGSNRGEPGERSPRFTATYPEGAIFLPEISSDRDIPEADEFLRKYLGELGLLAE
jgi:hypothetical protein